MSFALQTISEDEFQAFQHLIYTETGIALNDSKRCILSSRLAKRLRALQLNDYLEYYEYILRRDPDGTEMQEMINCMTKMDGLTFLSKLMAARPMPVVMVSSLTARGAETTLKALELGAFDFVTKPSIDVTNGTAQISEDIIAKVRAAATSRIRRQASGPALAVPPLTIQAPKGLAEATDKVIAIGASTGGTEALARVLPALPGDTPGTVVVQHMPKAFTSAFAQRLNGLCRMRVKEAENGDRIIRGTVLVAPGDFHMEVVRQGAAYYVKLNQQPQVNGFRPSVDVLFHSCANQLGPHATSAILTGMGRDGAAGMLAMRSVGSYTVAQDEESCVVFGMPKEAIALGGAVRVVPLDRIAGELIAAVSGARNGDVRETAGSARR